MSKRLLDNNGEKPNILCIDDDKRILRSIKATFRKTHNVYTTTSASEFARLLEEHHMHVILSDQRMPTISGTELLRFAKELCPNSIRILLTGYADNEAVISSINDSEVFRYIKKPWNLDEIRDIVQQATDIALTLQNSESIELLEGGDDNDDQLSHGGGARPTLLYFDEAPLSAQHFVDVYDGHYDITCVNDCQTFKDAITKQEFAIAVVNMDVNDGNIIPIINKLKEAQPFVMTVLLNQYSDSDKLIDLINSHQVHRYCLRPINSDIVKVNLQSAAEAFCAMKKSPRAQLQYLLKALENSHITDAPELKQRIIELLEAEQFKALWETPKQPSHSPAQYESLSA